MGPQAQAESVFFNNGFDIDVDDAAAVAWSKYIGLKRLMNLVDADTGDIFTAQEMEEYTLSLAPESYRGTPRARQFSDELMQSWPTIVQAIPPSVRNAITKDPEIGPGMYLHAEPPAGAPLYVRTTVNAHDGLLDYIKTFVDTYGNPHSTGEVVPRWHILNCTLTNVTLWEKIVVRNEALTEEEDPDEEEEETLRENLKCCFLCLCRCCRVFVADVVVVVECILEKEAS